MLDYTIENIQFNPPIDSSDMNPDRWVEMARAIEENFDRFDGFVVLHGTDTMAYTASALSFMLENLHKPVIITGSQLPIGEVRTDGEENLITALQIAAATDVNGEPMVQEVAILFENYLWRGNRSTKMSADNFNAFKSNNYPSLAKIGLGIHFNEEALMRARIKRPLKVRYAMDTGVMFVDLHPGITEDILNYLLNAPGIKGIVLRTFGAGNAPTSPWFIHAIKSAIDRGIVILKCHAVCQRRRAYQAVCGRRPSGSRRSDFGPRHDLRSCHHQDDVSLRYRPFGRGCKKISGVQYLRRGHTLIIYRIVSK